MLWEWRGIANMAFIQLGGNSRVDEMILARVSSGFAGEKYGATYKLYLGLLGGKEGFMGRKALVCTPLGSICFKNFEWSNVINGLSIPSFSESNDIFGEDDALN
ncbi:hypothetical protein Tco_0010998 [Tanacetum coccineum]